MWYLVVLEHADFGCTFEASTVVAYGAKYSMQGILTLGILSLPDCCNRHTQDIDFQAAKSIWYRTERQGCTIA